jgi:hypothetical protein
MFQQRHTLRKIHLHLPCITGAGDGARFSSGRSGAWVTSNDRLLGCEWQHRIDGHQVGDE